MIVGTGKDDASDALDRRVEFKVAPCGRRAAGRPDPKMRRWRTGSDASGRVILAGGASLRQRPHHAEADVVVMCVGTGLGANGRPQRRRLREPVAAPYRMRSAVGFRTRRAVGACAALVIAKQSAVHSQTLPIRSWRPKAFAAMSRPAR